MSQSHIPIDKICENQENNGSENAANGGGPDLGVAQNASAEEDCGKVETGDRVERPENVTLKLLF